MIAPGRGQSASCKTSEIDSSSPPASGPARPGPRPELTPILIRPPGALRILHSGAYQNPLRFAGRVVQVGREVLWSGIRDRLRTAELNSSQIIFENTEFLRSGPVGTRFALYLHYSPTGEVSQMVLRQLRAYQEQGSQVVFISNSPDLSRDGLAAAARYSHVVVRRRNAGLDFGAWRDAAALLLSLGVVFEELLLVNDSVLGPFGPIGPIVACAREVGTGFVGLTESWQGGVHLQSYFLMCVGSEACLDALGFLSSLRLSSSKWLTVQRGEFGLTRYMASRGHAVRALFGYERTLAVILADPEQRRYLLELVGLYRVTPWDDNLLHRHLVRWPLNPSVQLWYGLVSCLGFPFVKMSVVRKLLARHPASREKWLEFIKRDNFDNNLALDHLNSLVSIGRSL